MRHEVPKLTKYSPGAHNPWSDAFLPTFSAYRAWPAPLPAMSELDEALDRLNAVVNTPVPAEPRITVDDFLADAPAAVAASLSGKLTAERFKTLRDEVADAAARQLKTLAVAAFPTMHANINASWAEHAELLLSDPQDGMAERLAGADPSELSEHTRNQLAGAVLARRLKSAALEYSGRRASYRGSSQDYAAALVRILDFTTFDQYVKWRDGIGGLDYVPRNGDTSIAWALRCDATPTIIADRSDLEARVDKLARWATAKAHGSAA